MPYIPQNRRKEFDAYIESLAAEIGSAGELNYVITLLVILVLKRTGGDYRSLNEVMGVLSCVSAEFYRRVVTHYELEKIRENGDLFDQGVS